jgi:hypothetical protein
MTTGNLRLVHTNHVDDATLTASGGTIDSLNPLTNMQNTRRDFVCRTTDTTTTTYFGTYADTLARGAGFVGLMLHRLHGASVRFRLFPNADWTGSATYDSGTVAVATSIALTSTWGLAAGTAINTDLLYWTQPFWRWINPQVTFKSWSLVVSGTPATSAGSLGYFEITRPFIGPYFELGVNPEYKPELSRNFNSITNRDGGGGVQVTQGYQWRKLDFSLAHMTSNDRKALFDIAGYSGNWREGVVSMFPEDGTRDERDWMMHGRFAVLGPQVWDIIDRSMRLSFEES